VVAYLSNLHLEDRIFHSLDARTARKIANFPYGDESYVNVSSIGKKHENSVRKRSGVECYQKYAYDIHGRSLNLFRYSMV